MCSSQACCRMPQRQVSYGRRDAGRCGNQDGIAYMPSQLTITVLQDCRTMNSLSGLTLIDQLVGPLARLAGKPA